MVMPRSRSSSMSSRNCADISRAETAPVASRMRSASVDFPWSMWAMIEELRMWVAWLAPNGELLGVEFDDVARAADAQTLELPNGDVVTVRVKKGKVTVRQRHRARRTSAA